MDLGKFTIYHSPEMFGHLEISPLTLWKSNMAIENTLFIDDFPIETPIPSIV